jgi:LAO/AO transport system kinase
VFIETVGTGQSEVEIAAIADTTVVVQAPEMGDEVQAIKAGLLEVADLVVVTKGDRPGADRAAAQLRAMVTVGAQHDRQMGERPRPKRPEVLLVSAVTGAGVPELLDAIDRRAPTPGDEDPARLARAEAQLEGILADRVREHLTARHDRAGLVRAIAAHELDPYTAADRMLEDLVQATDGAPRPRRDPAVSRAAGGETAAAEEDP